MVQIPYCLLEVAGHNRDLNHIGILKRNMVFLAIVIALLCDAAVSGARTTFEEHGDVYKRAVKTIGSEDGDIIDCIDIYKQPALDHPLLRNHRIQMRPSSYPQEENITSLASISQHLWKKSGICPSGTVPIRRTKDEDLLLDLSTRNNWKRNARNLSYSTAGHESAVLVAKSATKGYTGARAIINVWEIHAEPEEFSASKITILSDDSQDSSSIQAGWMVNPQLFGDSRTRLYTYWTGDGFDQSGCYNILCSGFVQVSTEIYLGATITPVSTYGGIQTQAELHVYKDRKTRNWWLIFNDKAVGYWPTSIFKEFESASIVEWGGEVLNKGNGGHHTNTQMGSGHFAKEGYGKSSFFKNILVADLWHKWILPEIAGIAMQRSDCYDLIYDGHRDQISSGYEFFYGGPGYGPTSRCS